ncbi:MAG: acyl-CoA synthetase [Acidimicrobiales bacterium]|nr:acyl-CoA synthetase [Acidimicrobiales bacterium]
MPPAARPFDANIAEVFERVAARIPDREAVITPTRRLTFAEISERSNRLANVLVAGGIGCHTERDQLEPWESGQDHVALCLVNGSEYMEGMLAAWKARGVSFNVNYRYVAAELVALLTDAAAKAIVFHARFAPVIDEIRGDLPMLTTLIQVADDSGEALLDGALDYESALAAASPAQPDLPLSPDDLYMVYTGGTTGLPKGVLWRQADIWVGAMGGADPRNGEEFAGYDAVVEAATEERIYPYMIAAPLMHGGGQWLASLAWMGGDPVVFGSVVDRLDPADLLRTVERERCSFMIVIGNAFGRPILDELDRAAAAGEPYDFSSLRVLSTGAAAMTTGVKEEFLRHNPKLRVIDSVGASESGTQGRNVSTEDTALEAGIFEPGPGTGIIDDAMTAPIPPTPGATGWLSRTGRIPLGYLGDPEKTRRTFPTIDGLRYAVPGDRAEWLPDGRLKLLGRDSVCINTGGEKVFVEEVEAVLHAHPAVRDAVVVGRPSERWGNEVCAVVSTSAPVTTAELIDHCDGHLARYKLPRTVIAVPEVVRGPNGKADYRWAADVAANEKEQGDRP